MTTTPLEVTIAEIKALSDIQLTELLEKLIISEVREDRFSVAEIHITHNIKRGDGGIDATIDAKKEWKYDGFIKNNKIIYQIKAQTHPRSKCNEEVQKPTCHKLREKINEGFYYIIFCNKDSCPTADIEDRIAGIKDGLDAQGVKYSDNQLHFLDLTQIRLWVNSSNPAVQLWVKKQNNKHIPLGISTFDDWADNACYNDGQEKFCSSEELLSQLVEIGGKILDLIPDKPIRIVGHSGIGKTRRVYESIKLLAPEIRNKILYYRVEDSRHGEVLNLLNSTCEQDYILILDDCPRSLFNSLKNYLKSSKCQLKLITIDYEISELSSGDELTLQDLTKFDSNGGKIIEEILKIRLSQAPVFIPHIHRIATFAQGYPLLAIILAEALASEGTNIGELTDEELKKKLLWGRGAPDPQKEKILRVCSLFTSLGLEEELSYESKNICEVLEIKYDEFYEIVSFFRKDHKRIIQTRGRRILVVPLPLAAHLASSWFEFTTPEKIEALMSCLDDELKNNFCQQMRFLSDNDQVIKIVGQLCGISGPFGNAEVLNSDLGSRCFCFLAEVTPDVAVSTLEHIFHNVSIDHIKKKWGPGRRQLIVTLEKLVFRRETFRAAIKILYKFALAENETWANNATGQFKHLFHLILSGTEVPAIERLFIIEEAINSKNSEEHFLALKAIGSAFLTTGSRSVGAEFQGKNKPLIDWFPPTPKVAREYASKCLGYLKQIITGERFLTEERKEAIKVFCSNARTCITNFDLVKEVIDLSFLISQKYPQNNADILGSLSHIIKYDRDRISEDRLLTVKQTIESLLKTLSQNLDSEFNTFISGEPYKVDVILEEGEMDFTQSQKLLEKKSEEIARKYIQNNAVLDYLEYFITENHKNIQIFGRTIGREFKDSETLISKCLDIFEQNPGSEPTFIASVLNGIASNNPDLAEDLLDRVYLHPSLKFHLVFLTCFATKISERSLERILKAFQNSIINPEALNILNFGAVISHLKPDLVKSFVKKILEVKEAPVISIGFGIIFSYSYGDYKKLEIFSDIITDTILSKEGLIEISKAPNLHGDFYSLSEVLKYLIENSPEELGITLSIKTLASIIDASSRNNTCRIQNNTYIKELISLILNKHNQHLWPIIKERILKADTLESFLLRGLLGNTSNDFHQKHDKNALLEISWPTIKADLDTMQQEERNKICLFIVECTNLLEKLDNTQNNNFSWNERILDIINIYSDKRMLDSIFSNIFSYSCWGEISNYYEKYLIPFSTLKLSSNSVVSKWATDSLTELENLIKKQKVREEEFVF